MKWAKYVKESDGFKKNPRNYHRFWRIMGYEWKDRTKYDPKPLSVRFIHR